MKVSLVTPRKFSTIRSLSWLRTWFEGLSLWGGPDFIPG